MNGGVTCLLEKVLGNTFRSDISMLRSLDTSVNILLIVGVTLSKISLATAHRAGLILCRIPLLGFQSAIIKKMAAC